MKIFIKNINKEFDLSGLSPAQILEQTDLPDKRKYLVPRFNNQLIDWNEKIASDGTLEFLDFSSDAAKDVFRHTSSHIMAQAVKRLFPHARLAIGPAIEDGFYYDFDFGSDIQESSLEKIEAEINKIIKENLPIVRKVVSQQEAIQLFKEKDEPYKAELISELNDPRITIYSQGEFIDLCRGPHLMSTGKVRIIKLLRMSGAYWRGDEKNKMLQRIYGISFQTPEELAGYLKQVEEAMKRDHTRLGKELDLYILNPVIGKGLPLLTPKGTLIKQTLQRWIEDEETKRGYQFTSTPVLAKTELFKISGHLDHYRDKMFIFKTDENEELALRPMTCPYHFMIFKSKLRSYRELPIRYAETSTLFRKELSGELHGLIRIWQFTLADAHIICMPDQLEEEFEKVLDLIQYIMSTLGFKDYGYRFAKWDPEDKEKYIDNPRAWEESQASLKKILDKQKLKYEEALGEAAFYGPKLDIQMKNVWGKEDTIFTVQIDFALPERFDLEYIDNKNNRVRPMVIHRSSIGCYERTIAMLIEQYAGAFPLWLAPVQVMLINITDEQSNYVKNIEKILKENNIRGETDLRNEKMAAKVKDAIVRKVPYIFVCGKNEEKDNTVSVRSYKQGQLGTFKLDDFVRRMKDEIDKRSL